MSNSAFFKCLFLRERERERGRGRERIQSGSGGGAEREGDTESEASACQILGKRQRENHQEARNTGRAWG